MAKLKAGYIMTTYKFDGVYLDMVRQDEIQEMPVDDARGILCLFREWSSPNEMVYMVDMDGRSVE